MKILVIAHCRSDGTPTASFIQDQIRALQAAGCELQVLSPVAVGRKLPFLDRVAAPVESKTIDGIHYLFVRFLSLSKYGRDHFNAMSACLSVKRFLLRELAAFAPDLIHAHTLGFDSEIGAWLKERLGCPLVVTTHGGDAFLPLNEGKEALLRRWCDRADAVICVGEKLRACLAGCGTKTGLRTIPNGFNAELVMPPDRKKPMSILQVCNLVPSKRADVTIRAFAEIKKRYPLALLTIVGDGTEREKLEGLGRSLGLGESIRFTGKLPQREVFREMAAAEYFVMVSKPEGFGIVYLEAMASGCMAIGAQGEGIADVIVSGENGFLLPADDPDAIAETVVWGIEHPEERRAIAERGRACASVMTWEKNAQRTLTLFRELLEKRDALRR